MTLFFLRIPQIVERIKAVANETKLLVLDPEADAYYQERGIQVNGFQSNVVYLKTPAVSSSRPGSSNRHDESSDDDTRRVKMRHDEVRDFIFFSFFSHQNKTSGAEYLHRCAR